MILYNFKSMRKNITLVLILFQSTFLYSQDFKNYEIDIIKNFNPIISYANKINFQPLFIDSTKIDTNFIYDIITKNFYVNQDVIFEENTFETNLNIEKIENLENVASIRIGNFVNSNFSLNYQNNTKSNSYFDYIIDFKNALIMNDKSNKFSNFLIGTTYLKKNIENDFYSNLFIKDIYRFNHENKIIDNKKITFNSGINIYKSLKNKPLSLKFNSYYFNHYNNVKEYNFNFEISKINFKIYDQNIYFDSNISFQKSNNKDFTNLTSNFKSKIVSSNTKITYGISLNYLNSLKLFPFLNLTYEVLENNLYAYLNIEGERQLYNFSDIFIINPYNYEKLNSLTNLKLNNVFNFRFGLQGVFIENLTYNISTQANFHNNYLFFVHNYSSTNFNTDFNYTKLNWMNIRSELDYNVDEKLQILFISDIRLMKRVSYVPKYEFGFFINYEIFDKFYLSTNSTYLSKRDILVNYFDSKNNWDQLDGILNINSRVSFNKSQKLIFYLELNNILNKNILIWQENPILKRNLNFGIDYFFN